MIRQESPAVTSGSVVEFFESKEVICGVCKAVKNHRLTILTEQNREINLAESRLIHTDPRPLNVNLARDDLVRKISEIAALRKSLMDQVNLEELWSLIGEEPEEYAGRELAEFVFSEAVTEHHVAAIQRVLFKDRLYFQFRDGKFFARPMEKIDQRRIEMEREEAREAQLNEGSRWLQTVWNRKDRPIILEQHEKLIQSLKSYCIFGQESTEAAFAKELLKRANITPQPQSAFRLLVRLGVWHEDENLYLHEHNISVEFPKALIELADRISTRGMPVRPYPEGRKDLSRLNAFTVDSETTRDYDDALSLQILDNGIFEVGIHIADAAEFVAKGDPLDQEAEARASSIYLPDGRISMLPPILSDGICSLKAGEERFALSFVIRMNAEGTVQSREITASVVRIREQVTYEQVNERIHNDKTLKILFDLALKLRRQRLDRGAVILPLPEVNVHVNPSGMIQISRYEKETPSQIIVSEWMIEANGMAASYLVEHGLPGIYRSQAESKQETDFTQSEHELFRVYRKRRLFARAEMDVEPKPHCNLAMAHYTTVTSPIRRYTDLIVQRQLKHALAHESPLYTQEELRRLIVKLGAIQPKIFLIQRKWNRYWILKYIEQEDLKFLNALVLDQNHRYTHLLLPDFLMETNMQMPDQAKLQSGELIKVRIDRLNPREDILRIHL
ncbi:MAG: ribonuclease catalytic domain-containing protein [Syntrophobacteraceae bacterium]